MKRFAVALVFVIPLLLVACNRAQQVISVDKGTYVFFSNVGHPKEYYKITGEIVSRVGRLISKTNTATNGPAYWSSTDNIVAVYRIPGEDTNVEVAVKLRDGTYVKGTAAGAKQP